MSVEPKVLSSQSATVAPSLERDAMSEPQPFRPRRWRVLLGFVATPLLAAILTILGLSVYDGTLKSAFELVDALHLALTFTVFGAYPATILFGLPIYFALNGRVGYGPLLPIIVGYAIVALWVTLLQVAINTHIGLDELVYSASQAFAGALGGFIFWLIVVWRDPRRTRA